MDSQLRADANQMEAVEPGYQEKSLPLEQRDDWQRPMVKGKFLYIAEDKFWIRGVTYGTFRCREERGDFPPAKVVEADFAAMAQNGINSLRTYTVPPGWLLDAAQCHGLHVMVGLPWAQHVTFLDDSSLSRNIEKIVLEGVKVCKGHPAVLCYVLGNEIPSSIVRWHGRRRIEGFIRRLYYTARAEDPQALFTYVNYPTTEYLQLHFLDFVCYNIYLESEDRLGVYVARLQNLCTERPLVLTEIGLDSRRHGEVEQARVLGRQISVGFACGCAGVFVFSWTDEWSRGGYDIKDWDFGLTTRGRRPKPALKVLRSAYAAVPFSIEKDWPFISVVVCTYNGAATLRDTLDAATRLEYPNYEVIVIDDGSTDTTAQIASEYNVSVVSTENHGLSHARNSGWQLARGEIVAYIDDDAYPDPHWLTYLASIFLSTDHVGVGGPNLPPQDDGPIADCVANAPGGPMHVLISDTQAEHIPGCNMAFRRSALEAISGFDPRYRVAGDDVDLCWRLQQAGGTLGFHAAAVVWHHRRNSIRMYWRQQLGYGKAEALLEEKWPQKYNAMGQLNWGGLLYGRGLTRSLRFSATRLYQGIWGRAPFQSLYEPKAGTLSMLPLMPEWYLIVLVLLVLSSLGLLWRPMLFVVPLFGIAIIAPLIQASLSAARASFASQPQSSGARIKLKVITAFLHLLQPLARLIGRLRHGLTPWRQRGDQHFALPYWRTSSLWSEQWRAPHQWAENIESALLAQGTVVARGNEFETVDLKVRGGFFGSVNMLTAIEEHGSGRQLIRIRQWPRGSLIGLVLLMVCVSAGLGAYLDQAWPAFFLLLFMTVLLSGRIIFECGMATGRLFQALEVVKGGIGGDG